AGRDRAHRPQPLPAGRRGLVRFRGLEEAARALERVAADYEHQRRLALLPAVIRMIAPRPPQVPARDFRPPTPGQIQHGTGDGSVPSRHGVEQDRLLTEAGKPHESYGHPSAPHDWSGVTRNTAMAKTVAWFGAHLRG